MKRVVSPNGEVHYILEESRFLERSAMVWEVLNELGALAIL
jgi:hypothetical protein